MYTKNFFLVAVAAATGASATVFAERAVQARDASNGGWSLQSSSAVSGLTSCGDDAYCPSSFTCFAASQAVAAACCPSSSSCIGAVEGSPVCADASWTLYKNNNGNGFCCAAGQVGVLTSSTTGAGSCVDSVGSATTAIFVSSGTASASTSSSASASTTSATTTGSSSSASTTGSASAASTSGSASTTESSTSGSSTESSTSSATSGASSSSGTASGSAASASSTGSSGAIKNGMASGLGLFVGGLGVAFAL